MQPTTAKVGYEPIRGYTLRKRLGAGGYGEVWLADAPGGLQKAVKLIYGTVDESHAASELKSLERIRTASHPFLLSLERIEVVDGQVIIVTELAEGSLHDRFEQYRRKGEPGIPRAALLEMLRDTADALDFLAQKHSLQHLDVKPGNLLLIADRIKVADFGLVKNLHDQTQSLVGGLTPTYSAPEIFDGRPDYRSDQYSLAIVYMEMLTGHLPFRGKTTAELARQHINQAPSLEALPPADRAVVYRALSKNPLDRFPTCRSFVEQLQKTRGAVIPQLTPSPENKESSSDSERSSTSEYIKTATNPAFNGQQEFCGRLDLSEIKQSWVAPHSVFIGVGGIGCKALRVLRKLLNDNCDCRFVAEDHGWLAIDTTPETLNEISNESAADHVPGRHAIQLPIFKPSNYRNAAPDLFVPLSRRWLYNIPKSLSTEGVRPLAILTLLHHFHPLKEKLRSELAALIQKHQLDEECQEPLRIYLLSSLHGGTGSGLMCELGFLVRQLMRELNYSNYRFCSVVTAATVANAGVAHLGSAAAVSCLSELDFLMSPENEIPPLFYTDRNSGTSNSRPFDWVTLVDGGLHGDRREADRAVLSLANVVMVDSQTIIGAALSESRTAENASSSVWLRTACADAFNLSSPVTLQSLARWCCNQSLQSAAEYMCGPKGIANSSTEHAATPTISPTSSGDIPLTKQASEEITRRLLQDLAVVESSWRLDELATTEQGDTLLAKWAKRLSNGERTIEKQLEEDIAVWKESLSKIVHMRFYNWKQVEQIQLNVVEGILDYCDNETEALALMFEPFADLLGSPDQMQKKAIDYLRLFAEQLVLLLGAFQSKGKELSGRLQSWCKSIDAEKTLNEAAWNINVASLPSKMQLLANRTRAVLESTLHQETQSVVQSASDSIAMRNGKLTPLAEEHVTLRHMLSLAQDLVVRFSKELGLEPSDFESDQEHSANAINLMELSEYAPSLANSGGSVCRFAIVPAEQSDALESVLSARRLRETTTIVPCDTSLGTYVACEGHQLAIPQIIATLWRPTPATLQLAERIRTRVDVDWPSASELLESNVSVQPLGQPDATDIPPIILQSGNTGPINGTMQLNDD